MARCGLRLRASSATRWSGRGTGRSIASSRNWAWSRRCASPRQSSNRPGTASARAGYRSHTKLEVDRSMRQFFRPALSLAVLATLAALTAGAVAAGNYAETSIVDGADTPPTAGEERELRVLLLQHGVT